MTAGPFAARERRFAVLVGVLLALVFVVVARTTYDLRFPYDVDLFRDIGQADTVRDGHPFADANYTGELAWYNPLGSWLIGGLSWVTGIASSTLATKGGVIVNLISPVALTILVARWFGRRAAGFALVAFVFLMCGNYPSWAVATYSPWLFQANFAQGLFYCALLALPGAFEQPTPRRSVLLGALIGLVALAHTAPALILAAICVVVAIRQRSAFTIAVAAGTGLLVASPFLVPLAIRYRFDVVNSTPTDWVWDEFREHGVVGTSLRFAVRWPTLLAIGSAVWWWIRLRPRPTSLRTIVLATWTAVAAVGLALAAAGLTIVPSYHYFLYLTAAACVWFGIGVGGLTAKLPDWTSIALAMLLIVVTLPQWLRRDEFTDARDSAIAITALFDRFATSDWIADHTDSADVVLYAIDPNHALHVGALDHRRTVVVDPFFSSPFVPWEPRHAAADRMIAALAACDLPAFAVDADEYDVRYVVTTASGGLTGLADTCPGVALAHTDGYGTVLEVKSPTI